MTDEPAETTMPPMRIPGTLAVAVLIATTAPAGLLSPAVAVAGPPRMAVVQVSFSGAEMPPDQKTEFERVVAAGLGSRGFEVVGSAQTRLKTAGAVDVSGCENPACLVRVGDLTDAMRLVRGEVRSMGTHYRVELELFDAANGQRIGVESKLCEICNLKEAYSTAEQVATKIASLAVSSDATGKPAGAGEVSAAGGQAVGPVATHPKVELLAQPTRRRGALPWVAIGGGVLAAATGAVFIGIDGRESCQKQNPDEACEHVFQSMPYGIGLAFVGLAATIVGVTLLARPDENPGVGRVSLGPGGVSVSGRF